MKTILYYHPDGEPQQLSTMDDDADPSVLGPLAFLQVPDGTLIHSGHVQDGAWTPYSESVAQERSRNPPVGCVWSAQALAWVDARGLDELKSNARLAINQWRDKQEAAGTVFEHEGRMWDCNPAAKDKLQSTAAMDAVPPGFFWTDASEPVNQDVPMDIEAVRALNEAHKLAYFQRGLQIHVRQREMKAALDAMDAEQLAAFEPRWGAP